VFNVFFFFKSFLLAELYSCEQLKETSVFSSLFTLLKFF